MFGNESNFVRLDSFDRLFGKRLGFYKPLFANLRFDRRAAFVAGAHDVFIFFIYPREQSFGFEFVNNLRASLIDFHPGEFTGNRQKFAVKINNLFFIEVVPFGDFEIGRIVRRSDRHCARAEFAIDRRIFNHSRRNRSIDPFEFDGVAILPLRIAFIIRMHDHVFIAELRLRSSRCDFEGSVLQIVERILPLHIFDFKIGKRRLMF